jgi:hypothetical protein
MTGTLLIDAVDVYNEYKTFVTNGGYNGLIEFPDLKDVEKNDWPEEDGIEVDLSDPKLASREFAISLAFTGTQEQFFDFVKFITTGAVHEWNFINIGRTYNLRYVSSSDISNVGGLRMVNFRFADDYPLEGYTYIAPESSIPLQGEDYELDTTPFINYGINILDGTLSEIEKIPTAKVNLLRTNMAMNGAAYFGDYVTFHEKFVKIKCLMQAANLAQLWQNWDALLYNLSKPGVRTIYSPATEKEYPCYYTKCKVSQFEPEGKIWLAFELEVVFMSMVIEGEEVVLASEDEQIIVTEDDEYAIDMS